MSDWCGIDYSFFDVFDFVYNYFYREERFELILFLVFLILGIIYCWI